MTSPLSRRSFLTGSSYFAAAMALAAATGARAQDPPKQDPAPTPTPKPTPKEEERRRGPKTDEEIFAEQEKQREELVDDDGRQYRICPQCGFKMYRQGRTWTCTNCGYNYVD
jgi:hypothetical protein